MEEHISHPYSEEMEGKSNIANIGIFLVNPGTVEGSLTVLEKLHKLVPQPYGPEAAPCATPVHGDAGSVMGMLSAKNAQIHGMTPEERLEGIWPVPGDFHRRMIHLQDTMNMLWTNETTSAHDRGTLSNIRTVFSIKSVKAKVSDSFNHVEDLVHVATKGLVVLAARKLMGLDSCLDSNADADEDRQERLQTVSQQIATYFWSQPSMGHIQSIIEADDEAAPEPYCVCKEHKGKCTITLMYLNG